VRIYQADWLLPIAEPPVRRGWVMVANGRIVAAGGPGELPAGAVDLGPAAIVPGLVNAHTHLELSYLHERIPRTESFGTWVRAVMEARKGYPDPAHPDIIGAAAEATAAAHATGTVLVGDVTNTLVTVPLLRQAGMAAQIFHELTGFTEQEPEARVAEARARVDAAVAGAADIRGSVAPHAPYSVSPALFAAIRADIDAHPGAVSTVHLGENPEEVELLRHGTGAIRTVLEDLGRWPTDWRAPGVSPVDYLFDLGFLGGRTLVVHGVQFVGEDLARVRAIGATLVSCPRSNVNVGVGSPPLEAFYAMDVDVAFGTDSLASVADLNLFAELAEARRIAPLVPARRLLESATLTGARALRFDAQFGSIEAGKRAQLLLVHLPAGTGDVEEYLVSGVPPSAVQWLHAVG
jgi:cytosine/adenosine deaminase-related metal-dependent hydrolase